MSFAMNKYSRSEIVTALVLMVFAQHAATSAEPAKPQDEAPALALFSGPSKEAKEKAEAALKQAAAKPTPRTAQGKPDLTGMWQPSISPMANFGGAPDVSEGGKRFEITLPPVKVVNNLDNQNVARRRANPEARPQYVSPEHQAKAKYNFENADFEDPVFKCAPPGVPRIGIPQEIVQTKNAVYFLYQNQNRYRIIPIDGRKHDPKKESMANGDSIGHWQGDTLVVDTVNISEDTWLDRDGSFHGPDLRVIESFTRKGDTLTYSARAEDPWFTKPFMIGSGMLGPPGPATLLLAPADQHVEEDYPCIEQSRDHMVSKERH